MSVNSLERDQQPPYILACGYCKWTTLDIGIKFEKSSNIGQQLAKIRNGGGRKSSRRKPFQEQEYARSLRETRESVPQSDETPDTITEPLDSQDRFNALKSFYKSQINDPSAADPMNLDSIDSPSQLSRLVTMYAGVGNYGKKSKPKGNPYREAYGREEGMEPFTSSSEVSAVTNMQQRGWDEISSMAQKKCQTVSAQPPRFVNDLRPIPVTLHTKRSKRCRQCKHILVKPDPKSTNIRFRMRLVAVNYMPSVKLSPLPQASPSSLPDLDALRPLQPVQFLLTLKNPMFDAVRVTLATPAQTPGRVKSKVTVLCPQFELGANSEVWDELLKTDVPRRGHSTVDSTSGEKLAEAGKVWEKGRNFATVVVEVVPGSIESAVNPLGTALTPSGAADGKATIDELDTDEDLLEIPIFVRCEWETDVAADATTSVPDKERKEKRELAYWMVLGVGKIARIV